uniref:PPPDE domain-containing protein n=1 Tax=Ananas comosus var. bracteatus TaxID=296719 RepID=A0A6V7QQA0_ANACO
MGAFSSSSRSSEGFPVVLNVYDLTPLNDYLYWFGIGIYHSGIEVHGMEYSFGAHDYPSSGVFEVEPKKCPGFIYRCSILLGRTDMLPYEFRAFIENMAADYHGDTYQIISKNCNHFTDDASLKLTGRSIPGWVNRLAKIGALCNCLLPESMRMPPDKQIAEYHGYPDRSESFSMMAAAVLHSVESADDSADTDQEKHLLSSSDGSEVTLIKEVQR